MKTKCLLYCTKAKPYLFKWYNNGKTIYECETVGNVFKNDNLNGTIAAECEVECEEIKYHPYECTFYTNTLDTIISSSTPVSSFEKASCLSYFELEEYLNKYETDKVCGYALHISKLKVFDEPLRLSEILKYTQGCYRYNYIKVAPQNMMWVRYKGERYCLISVRPEWYCKILNGEKEIEVRKKVLKEMLERK